MPWFIGGRFGRADHVDIRMALGLGPKAKLPKEGIAPQVIQGYKVWVEPFTPRVTASGRKAKSSRHRAKVECPGCGKVMSVGRIHQHICKES